MWLQHLKFTVGVLTIILLVGTSYLILNALASDKEKSNEGVYNLCKNAIEILRKDVYFN